MVGTVRAPEEWPQASLAGTTNSFPSSSSGDLPEVTRLVAATPLHQPSSSWSRLSVLIYAMLLMVTRNTYLLTWLQGSKGHRR